jgi:hypothetical protein
VDIDLQGWKYMEGGKFDADEKMIEEGISYIAQAVQDIGDMTWDGTVYYIKIPTYFEDYGFLIKTIRVDPKNIFNFVGFDITYKPLGGGRRIFDLSYEDTVERYDPENPQKALTFLYDHIDRSMDQLQKVKNGDIDLNPTDLRGPSELVIKTGVGADADSRFSFPNILALRFEELDPPLQKDKVESYLDRVDYIVKHEILHFGQYLLKTIFDLDQMAGLPPKAVQTDPDIRGPNYQDHAQRDIEFYTRLNDEVDLFMEFVSDYDPQVWKPLAKAFMRQPVDGGLIDNRFSKWGDFDKDLEKARNAGRDSVLEEDQNSFEVWQQEEPQKYQKAVKEFWKAVQDRMD